MPPAVERLPIAGVHASMLSTAYIDGLNCIAEMSDGPASDAIRGGPSPIQPLGRNTLSTTNGSDPASTLGTLEGHVPLLPVPLLPLMPVPEPVLPECEPVPLAEPVPLPVVPLPVVAPVLVEPVLAPVPLPLVEPLLAEGELDAHAASPPSKDIAATGASARNET